MPKEETSPIPLKHIDLTRSTHTDLDVMQEKRIDDDWNFDTNKSLSDSLTLFKERPPPGVFVVRVETGKSSDDYVTRSCVA